MDVLNWLQRSGVNHGGIYNICMCSETLALYEQRRETIYVFSSAPLCGSIASMLAQSGTAEPLKCQTVSSFLKRPV